MSHPTQSQHEVWNHRERHGTGGFFEPSIWFNPATPAVDMIPNSARCSAGHRPPLSARAAHVRSSEKIGLGQFDHFITASVQNGLDHIQGKPFCHSRSNLGRHRKLHTLDSDVNDGRSIM